MRSYGQYLSILRQISISMFEWKNIPSTIDSRYIEQALFYNAASLYFNDEVVGNLALDVVCNGNFNVYGEPVRRVAYSKYNNYRKSLYDTDSVIIWNNMDRTPTFPVIELFAQRLYNLDRIIDVNANAQKTPVLLKCDQKLRLTLLNAFKENHKSYYYLGNILKERYSGNIKIYEAEKNWLDQLETKLLREISFKKNPKLIRERLLNLKNGLNNILIYVIHPQVVMVNTVSNMAS